MPGYGKGIMKSVSEKEFVYETKKPPNRLLQGLIGVSLVIHFFILLHVAGIYRSNALTYIELAVRDFSKPVGREIPRPRIRYKPPEIANTAKLNVPRHNVPNIHIDKVDTAAPCALTEAISMPDTGGLSADVAQWQPAGSTAYLTRSDYFDMLRMRIESRKKYPPTARKRQIEGRVEVGFLVGSDGSASDVAIVKTSRHPDLDRAALLAVQNAAPFPRPPSGLFDGPLKMTITIMFELM